jgi:hypothetical protein
MSRTLALVESPAQLLNLLEWVLGERRGMADPGSLDVAVLLPLDGSTRRQLDAMVSIARRAEGIGVSVHDIRRSPVSLARSVAALAPKLARAGRLVIGDPFSGLIQRLLPLSRAQDVVLVDDGTATLELSAQLLAGAPLVRWHRTGRAPRAAVRAARRLTPGHGRRLEVFSSLATDLRLPPGGVASVNGYTWIRSSYGPPQVLPGVDLVGTSLAETGLVSVERYVAEVAALAGAYGVGRYLAHRREDPAKLARIAAASGLEIVSPALPLELALRSGPVARTVVSFPSTVVHTLPTVLEGTGVEIVLHDSVQSWLLPGTSDRAAAFLSEVTTTARSRHHLSALGG